MRFFSFFYFKYKYIVSINFRANLDARNLDAPDPPIHAWYVGHTHGLPFRHCYIPNILSHRKVPFQEMPPHGKILKKGPGRYIIRILQHFTTKLRNITNFVMLLQVVMKFLSRLVIRVILSRLVIILQCMETRSRTTPEYFSHLKTR